MIVNKIFLIILSIAFLIAISFATYALNFITNYFIILVIFGCLFSAITMPQLTLISEDFIDSYIVKRLTKFQKLIIFSLFLLVMLFEILKNLVTLANIEELLSQIELILLFVLVVLINFKIFESHLNMLSVQNSSITN